MHTHSTYLLNFAGLSMSVQNAFLFEKRTAAEDNNDNQQFLML